MSTAELKKTIKKAVDVLPPEHLQSLADYARFLANERLRKALADAKADVKAGRTVSWRKVIKDV